MKKESKFNLRSFTSFTLVISTIIMSWSGFILYVAPPGRIANWGTWKLMLFAKAEWQALHTIFLSKYRSAILTSSVIKQDN